MSVEVERSLRADAGLPRIHSSQHIADMCYWSLFDRLAIRESLMRVSIRLTGLPHRRVNCCFSSSSYLLRRFGERVPLLHSTSRLFRMSPLSNQEVACAWCAAVLSSLSYTSALFAGLRKTARGRQCMFVRHALSMFVLCNSSSRICTDG